MKYKYGIRRDDDPLTYDKLRQQALLKIKPLCRILPAIKSKCKKSGIKFDIDYSDLKLPKYCPILGLKLKYNKNKRLDNSYSVDRVDPKKGYVKGNVRVISWKANRMKNNLDLKFLKKVQKYIEDHNKRNKRS